MTAITSPTQTEATRAGELGSSATATDTDRCPTPSGADYPKLINFVPLPDLDEPLSPEQLSLIFPGAAEVWRELTREVLAAFYARE